MLSKAVVLLSTVALLLPMVFFTFASPPLLVLKHDTPQDARVIRTLFSVYYTMVAVVAGVGAAGHLLVGRMLVALAMSGVAALALGLWRWFIPRMDTLRGRMADGDTAAVARFRRLHVAGILLNLGQLGAVAWGVVLLAAP
jgi:hypothetical protein